MSGLIGAAQMAGEMAKISLWELFSLAAWFSVSVGLMNLLPIPLLDGGHLAFYAFEAVAGRPLSERVQEIGLRESGSPWSRFWWFSPLRTTSYAWSRTAINQRSTILRVPGATLARNGVVSVNKGLHARAKIVKRR